jgi:hypothetical protein
MRSDTQIPLPRGWPHRIRSAVIHVISLAHFSLTFARSVAANSINARIRLNAENGRQRRTGSWRFPPHFRCLLSRNQHTD